VLALEDPKVVEEDAAEEQLALGAERQRPGDQLHPQGDAAVGGARRLGEDGGSGGGHDQRLGHRRVACEAGMRGAVCGVAAWGCSGERDNTGSLRGRVQAPAAASGGPDDGGNMRASPPKLEGAHRSRPAPRSLPAPGGKCHRVANGRDGEQHSMGSAWGSRSDPPVLPARC
jgi:hypothetical protein